MAEADGVIQFRPIAEAGPGATVVAVGLRNGEVVLQFPEAVQWAALDPQTAVQVAEQMARAGYEARYGRQPPANEDVLHAEIRKKVTDLLRETMINRFALMLKSMQSQRKNLNYQATELVDRLLQEVA